MGALRSFSLLVLSLVFLANSCLSTEFVPVYMWGNPERNYVNVPALHKISQSSFKDEIINRLKSDPVIIVFAEQTLSPEDFSQRDETGNIAFPYLSKLRKTSKVAYLPYVQNPIKATKHSGEDVSEISIERLQKNLDIPNSKILIVNLNDARDNEQRFDMLKRHDSTIASVYNEVLEKYDNILALYTAHHTSWVGSEEIVHSRGSRSLLATDNTTTQNQYFDTNIFYYTSGNATITVDKSSVEVELTYSANNVSSAITLNGAGTVNGSSISAEFTFQKTIGGYWQLSDLAITYSTYSISQTNSSIVYAPLTFSYACGNQTFKNVTEKFSIMFPNFQVQPLYRETYLTKHGKFDDPYNCVGFTSIPIWSGLFVTFILMLIMTFGLTMMMDIKTMDRFDDAKGKTITINTSE